MKKIILSLLLSTIMILTCTLQSFSHDALTDEVKRYNVAIVENGTIVVDGKCDDAYFNSNKIVNDDEACNNGVPYQRPGQEAGWADGDGTFESYIVVDTTGMFIWAKMNDKTMADSLNGDANDGEMLQLYFDWTPDEIMHPSLEERQKMDEEGNPWDPGNYKKENGASLPGMQYLGWISVDYTGVITSSAGFAPADSLGENFEGCQYAYTRVDDENYWTAEIFVPWRDSGQKEAIANRQNFHCSIGYQVGDDTNHELNGDGKEVNEIIRFDQCQNFGLSYWADYSLLSDIKWGEDPDPSNPETHDSIIAIVATLAIAGAGLAVISKKKEN